MFAAKLPHCRVSLRAEMLQPDGGRRQRCVSGSTLSASVTRKQQSGLELCEHAAVPGIAYMTKYGRVGVR